MKKLLFATLILLASVNISFGAVSWSGNTCTITGDATVAQINACLTDGSTGIVAQGKTGEITVQLPADTQAWTSGISINMRDATYINVTSLIIKGAGTIPTGSTKGSAGSTIITTSGLSSVFTITTTSSKKFRLTNITISGTVATSATVIAIYGTTKPSSGGGFRIDHMNLSSTAPGTSGSARTIYVTDAYGVIDHNSLYTNHMVHAIYPINGNVWWATPVSVGSSDMVFIEDNISTKTTTSWLNTMFADARNGARVVVRYNDISNAYLGCHGFDNSDRSVAWYEAYNNTIRIVDRVLNGLATGDARVNIRGGTYIVYNNTMVYTESGVQQSYAAFDAALWAPFIYVRNYRSDPSMTGYSWNAVDMCDTTMGKMCTGTDVDRGVLCTTDANCDGETGACQTIDGNETGNGWPCRDQPGVLNTHTTYTISNTYQLAHYPSLFWNNIYIGGTYLPPSVPAVMQTHIANDRDYCHHATTMPASCGGIATTYSAYIYPHPLVSGVTDTTAPTISAVTPTGTQPSCTGDSDDYTIGVTAQDNVAVTGVKCCAASVSCDSTTTYGDMDLTLSYVSGENWTKTETVACNTTNKTYYCRATDAHPNYSSTAAIVFSTPDGSDAVAPTMSTQAIGADGRTVTFTFSEPVTIGAGGSGGFTLTNGDAEEIAITYVSGANSDTLVYQTSACVPSTDTFTTGLAYTQPTNGIEDLAGNDLASFTGAGAKTVTNGSTQSCDLATSLFTHPESAPSGSTNASGNAVNLGVKFQTSTAGTMTHCWFYKIAADTGTHTCTVYRVLDGSTVGTVDFADESESGWQDQAFASALNIAANEDYIVTVSHPTGNWTSNVDYFASTYTNGNLTATTAGTDYPGRYVYGASMAYPTNDSARNYWTDFTMSYAGAGGPWQCTVSRTGDGCMVTGSQVVTNGNTCSATVTLRNGWKATWGGTCPAGSETGGIYTTGAVTADCTLIAACTEQYILP